MIDDKLIKKLESIEDLPISEEMLGAYLEGNLDSYDQILVETSFEVFPKTDFLSEIEEYGINSLDNIELNDIVISDEHMQGSIDDGKIITEECIDWNTLELPEIDAYIARIINDIDFEIPSESLAVLNHPESDTSSEEPETNIMLNLDDYNNGEDTMFD